jgi:hypothetical protein
VLLASKCGSRAASSFYLERKNRAALKNVKREGNAAKKRYFSENFFADKKGMGKARSPKRFF